MHPIRRQCTRSDRVQRPVTGAASRNGCSARCGSRCVNRGGACSSVVLHRLGKIQPLLIGWNLPDEVESMLAGEWIGFGGGYLGAAGAVSTRVGLGSAPKISHVIPLQVLQLLKSERWNSAVFWVQHGMSARELRAELVRVDVLTPLCVRRCWACAACLAASPIVPGREPRRAYAASRAYAAYLVWRARRAAVPSPP